MANRLKRKNAPPLRSRLNSKRRDSRYKGKRHDHHDKITPHSAITEILSIDGLIVTFKTEDGVTYKLDFEDTFENEDGYIERRLKNPEIFNTIKVEDGQLAFIDNTTPVIVGYPDGDREEITYNLYFTIADCMDLLEKVSD